ncbi:hypothetical protein EXIGLDRAFT_666494 [Exidia glandulosa HHB12029]|uniref:BTB domain-containing protein n=1 Tax=Exidia glandulosa HHB12029 TaxID=1314781 RepID=A0A165NTN1_EXIGL|nr:hypothetical protein EXIGLDRAFT_666494 [Exidia glandulosa HHB12029]
MTEATTSSATLAALHRHDDLWLSDGSVVLVAEDTLFKVHKSQLSRHSVVFRDMFGMPQSTDGGELRRESLDGCDVVRLHDSAQDIESLLRALYDGPSFGDNSETDFAVVSGVLRLSNKYLIEPLRTRAIAHLSAAWPSTLSTWDAREEVADRAHRESIVSPKTDEHPDFINMPPRPPRFYPHAARVLTLAREVNAPALLPSAFYELARHSFSSLLSTDPRAGSPSPASSSDILTGMLPSQPEIDPAVDTLGLSSADFRRLVLGKEAAASYIISLIRSMAVIRSGNAHQAHHHAHAHSHTHSQFTASPRATFCATPAACRKDFHELAELATQHYVLDRHYGSADPLYVAEELGSLKSAELAAQTECRACAFALESWSQREREKIWKLIPSWFRLDCWE